MTAHPPLPEPHPVRYPLWVAGRWVATCACHKGVALTMAGELPTRMALVSQS